MDSLRDYLAKNGIPFIGLCKMKGEERLVDWDICSGN